MDRRPAAANAAAGHVVLFRRLDDDQRVPVRVAQPEHRRHRPAVATDLGVDVDRGGLQGGVIGGGVAMFAFGTR